MLCTLVKSTILTMLEICKVFSQLLLINYGLFLVFFFIAMVISKVTGTAYIHLIETQPFL